MVMNVKGYAALAVKEDLVPHSFVRRDPREDDVVIDILYSGVCHSDIHNAYNDWAGLSIRWCRDTKSLAVWCMSGSR